MILADLVVNINICLELLVTEKYFLENVANHDYCVM